jgi:hypothetical protein
MALDRTKILMFAGKKFTMEEFIKHYGMEGEPDATVEILINTLKKKGKLHYIEHKDKEQELFEKVGKEIDLQARIAEMEAEADAVEAYKTTKNKEGKLMYEEVEIDFPTKTYALEFFEYAQKKLRVEAELYEQGNLYVLVLKNVAESDLAAIKRKRNFAEAGKVVINATDKFAEAAVGTAAFATEKVIAPTTKAAIKTTLGLTKSLLKTSTTVGSNLVTSTANSSRQMVTELANDSDVLKAKKELIDAKDAIVRMFRRGPKAAPDFRIK